MFKQALMFALLFFVLGAGASLSRAADLESAGKVTTLPANIVRVPMTRQATDYTCGVAALQSILAFFGDEMREDVLCKKLKSHPSYGTKYREIEKYARSKGYSVSVRKKMSLPELKKLIDRRKPVLCLIQAWAEREVDYKSDWVDGHYVVAIGYDKNNIFFMDPSTLGNYAFIPNGEFLDRWHDTDGKERLFNFGMVIEKAKTAFSQDLAKKLE